MSNYYSEKVYNGQEAIAVAMDIGTTHSELGSSDWNNFDLIFQAPYHSPTSFQVLILKHKWYFNATTTKFYLTVE
jgi:hypothetical protein